MIVTDRTMGIGLLAVALIGCAGVVMAGRGDAETQARTDSASISAPQYAQIVALRRLTESQYRTIIADVFGPDIKVAGRFEPIVRPVHELIASGAREAAISPSGLEQFDAIARVVAAQVFDEAHRSQFVPCTPNNAKAADTACARATLEPIARYLFRRSLSATELAFYTKLAGDGAVHTQSFHKGLELALAAMLTSPRFLYVVETAEPDPERPGELRLDNTSRATRLSMLLWNSGPNETLLRAAEAGQLTDQANLRQVAERMVRSPRFEQGLRSFFADMLLFEKFDELAKDPVIFPYFNTEVAQALPEQTLRTVIGHLLSENGDYRDLFTTRRTYMTRALGALYHVPVKSSHGWEPYTFAETDDRAGILGQAGFLALYSQSGRSSPTLRGRAIREVLMCQPVPNPPGDVNFTAVQDVNNKSMPTARIRLSEHALDPACSGCHDITDPPGLALERFDGIGAFRAKENGVDIDTSGFIGDLTFKGAAGLGRVLASTGDATQCVASRALEYATGVPATDKAALTHIGERFAADSYRIRSLFLTVASMPEAYQVRSAPTGASHSTATRR